MNKNLYPLREENLITKHILHVKFHAKHTAIPFFHKGKVLGDSKMGFSNTLWQISHVTRGHAINRILWFLIIVRKLLNQPFLSVRNIWKMIKERERKAFHRHKALCKKIINN